MHALTIIRLGFTGIMAVFISSCGKKNNDSNGNISPNSSQSTPSNTPNSSTALSPDALIKAGAKVYKRCQACHTIAEGAPHKVGPNLWDIVGSTAGSKEGFRYSVAMSESGVVWSSEALREYIRNPREFMPKNKMSFVGLRKDKDLDAVIAYITARSTPTQ